MTAASMAAGMGQRKAVLSAARLEPSTVDLTVLHSAASSDAPWVDWKAQPTVAQTVALKESRSAAWSALKTAGTTALQRDGRRAGLWADWRAAKLAATKAG